MSGDKQFNLGMILLRLNHALPHTPGLTEANIEVYTYALEGLPIGAIKAAVTELIRTWEMATILPTPGTIRRIALDLLAEQQGIPTAEAAWREVRARIASSGTRDAKFSHSAIDTAVEAMGGRVEIARSTNLSADRAHWLKTIYPGIRQWYINLMAEEIALALAAGTKIEYIGPGGNNE